MRSLLLVVTALALGPLATATNAARTPPQPRPVSTPGAPAGTAENGKPVDRAAYVARATAELHRLIVGHHVEALTQLPTTEAFRAAVQAALAASDSVVAPDTADFPTVERAYMATATQCPGLQDLAALFRFPGFRFDRISRFQLHDGNQPAAAVNEVAIQFDGHPDHAPDGTELGVFLGGFYAYAKTDCRLAQLKTAYYGSPRRRDSDPPAPRTLFAEVLFVAGRFYFVHIDALVDGKMYVIMEPADGQPADGGVVVEGYGRTGVLLAPDQPVPATH